MLCRNAGAPAAGELVPDVLLLLTSICFPSGLLCRQLSAHKSHEPHNYIHPLTPSRPFTSTSMSEAEIPLSASFPLPFRVLFLGGLGILGWATNLHGLHAAGLDGTGALDLQVPGQPLPFATRPGAPHLGSHPGIIYEPVYRLAGAYWAWTLSMWVIYRLATGGEQEWADVFKYIPSIAMLGVFAMLLAPWDVCRKRERDLFLL
jgi:hypothetical protein